MRAASIFGQLTFVACTACAPAVFAHHSRANYDMTKEIVVEGTVTELAWKNPHIFMTVETEGEPSRLEIELTSVSEARALGLPREAIAPGARVVARVHPGRGGPSARAVGLDLKVSDGSVYPLNTDARFAITPAIPEARGIAGRWAPTVESFNGFSLLLRSLPLTEAGRAAAEDARSRFNAESVAVLGICEPFPPPTLAIFPDLRTIEVNDATVVMRFEGGVGVIMERVVHLNQDDHPADVAPSLMGHSIGRWEGETLVIDTVAFSPHPAGVFFLQSGPRKHLVERLTLTADRLNLEYAFTLEDPDLFAEPASYTATWNHRPDLEFSGEPCDPEVARRALEQ
jgi:uncharacterized protein DUF6152